MIEAARCVVFWLSLSLLTLGAHVKTMAKWRQAGPVRVFGYLTHRDSNSHRPELLPSGPTLQQLGEEGIEPSVEATTKVSLQDV